MRDYFTFDNRGDSFKLGKGLEAIVKGTASVPMVDPIQAKELFMKQSSAEDLLKLPEGPSTEYLVFNKSDLERMSDEDIVKTILDPQSSGKRVVAKKS